MAKPPEVNEVRSWLTRLQDDITHEIETIDGAATFASDTWERAAGGGGTSRVLKDGAIFEQAGVGFSHVTGNALPPSASANRPELAGKAWQAMGVSLVFHPRNPFVPTTHMNVRFFMAGEGDSAAWWFGGGYDLTPYYLFDDEIGRAHV